MSPGGVKAAKTIEDAYSLSAMQEGMLFHGLSEPGSGLYVVQHVLRFEGVELETIEQAFQALVDRHPILRTAFAWQGLEKPLQVVGRDVRLPVERLDWRGLEPSEQEERLSRHLLEDRRRGFSFSRAPLLRLASIRLAPDLVDVVWTLHHILLDGWSVALALQEVLATYASLREGRKPRLGPAPPYKDYVAWLAAQDLSRAEAFWRSELRGFRSPTPLGIARARTLDEGEEAHRSRPARLTSEATTALQAMARQARLTLNTIVQGAWALALSRYSGDEDVVYGTVVSGRPPELAGSEAMLGLFINTLPVRVRVDEDERLRPWLRHLQERQAALRPLEHTPLVEVQGWSEVPRGRPLFETLLAFENYPAPRVAAPAAGGLRIRRALGVESTHFPLTLAVKPDGELLLKAVYDARRIEDEAVSRLLGHFRKLLEALGGADADTRLADLPLVPEAERRRLLAFGTGVEHEAASDAPVPVQLADQAARRPDALAVGQGTRSLRYGALDRRANHLAHRLRGLGVGPEVRVGVCTERSIEMVIGLLGILKAGGAYLPLDPSYPADRLAFMLEDAGVAVLVTDERNRDLLPEARARVVCLGEEQEDEEREAEEPPAVALDPANLAYVIYTSGSTGRPKGVELTHGGLANLVAWHRRAYEVTSADRATQVAALAFDASVWEIWPYLTAGASLHLPDEATRESPERLKAWIAGEGITLAFLPTPLAEAVLRTEGPEPVALRALLTGGDRLHTLPEGRRPFRVVNHYGPTEATVVATAGDVDDAAVEEPPIGRPIDNTRAYLLDARLRPVPAGVPGELYLGGAGLARGYLGRPDLTAERFAPDPFGPVPGARLYRTGDLARFRSDGRLDFLGRVDAQVKVRGFRIELGEVECVLASHPGVRAAAVVVTGKDKDRRLVACVAPTSRAPEASELREFLHRRLPEHMVPSAFLFLEALPLSPNGKVDRRALAGLDLPVGPGPEIFDAPRTPLQQALAEIWADVLGAERVGFGDSFFDLGGHSLLATRVVSQVRRTFGVDLSLRALFEAPTLAGLAERIEAARAGSAPAARPTPPLVPTGRSRPLPLSFAQQRLWMLDRMEPGNPAYNVPVALCLEGRLDGDALERSLGEIVRRHEVLRTTFATDRGEAVQRIHEPGSFRLQRVDLTDGPEAAREETAREAARAEARRPFDLERGPLLRATLLRLSPERHVLVLVAHHIVSDGWSGEVFSRELAALYRAFSRGEPSPLAELPLQYADFARWQRQWLGDGALEDQLAYWRERLDGAPPLALPTDRPRPRVQTYRAGRELVGLSEETAAGLRTLCRREGATLFMALLAAFQSFLSRWGGQEDFVVGTPIANRRQAEVEGLIGFFVNTLALRADLSGRPRFRELLARVRETTLGAFDHQDLPFDRLVEELNPGRDLSRNPLVQVLFAFQNAPAGALDLAGLALRPFPIDPATTRFDLEFHWWQAGGRLAGLLVYNADLWDAPTVAAMGEQFRTLLAAAVARPDERVCRLPLLAPEDERRLEAWSRGPRSGYPRLTIPEAFAAQVSGRPQAPAVVFGETTLDYAELDRKANRLAHRLLRLGVGPDTRVGVFLERSPELVVTLLAVLKAGGAYLPLDAASPPERLGFLLEDAHALAVVTDSRLLAALPAVNVPVLCLDREADALAREDAAGPPPMATPDHLAYVTYTSGSTGHPKGVEVPHRGVLRLLFGLEEVRLGPEERTLLLAPVSFDASTFEIWGALLHGGACVVHPEGVPGAGELGEAVRRHGVTTLWLTASLFNALVDEAPDGLRGLRQLLIGGEALSPAHVRRAQAHLPGTRIINGYGPTEGTTFTCLHAIPVPLPEDAASIPIGRPLPNTDAFVLDEELQAVPAGVPGELFVGGAGLARGYLGRADLTAERFVPSPFDEGARLYRTGDRVRWRAEGTIEFLGRRDHQVKLRGFRIELGEVEAALARLPEVREAVVLLRDGSPGEKSLVAYVVPQGDARPDALGLRDALRRRLPAYMVPAAFVLLEALPLGRSGKVDRRALPAPEGPVAGGHAPPRDDAEERIAAVWRDVLGLERVSIHDNFFDLGGHSLLLVRAHERIRAAFGLRHLPVLALFEHPTVASLAAHLRRGAEGDGTGRGHRGEMLRDGQHRLDRRRRLRREGAGVEAKP